MSASQIYVSLFDVSLSEGQPHAFMACNFFFLTKSRPSCRSASLDVQPEIKYCYPLKVSATTWQGSMGL